ncbi:MAG: hydantoinase B/oxoprolinase family protein, partial [Nitrospinota bacterium]|nr:hydantoinase B/oxoprolinase family protein [Nitrospinota bacterium]
KGDQFITNLTEIGGNHLPDVKLIKPIFVEGETSHGPVVFSINLAHWPDVGGALPGSYVPWATEIYQEGLQIPPIRLFTSEGPVEEAMQFILQNVRNPRERRGDILAQFAANEFAERRILSIVAEHGLETVLATFGHFFDESETLVRSAIVAIPDGQYEGEDFLDNDGVDDRPVRIKTRITVDHDEIEFDFAGTDPLVRGPVNTTRFIAAASCYYSVKVLIANEAAVNEGFFRPIRVKVPQSCLLDAQGRQAPVVGGNHETSQRVVDAIFKALVPVFPERIVAGGPTTSGLLLFSGRKENGEVFTLYEVHGGGEGASLNRDGTGGVRVHMSNVMNTPIEALEMAYPLRVERYSLREGSGGMGRRRGGEGVVRAYRVLVDSAMVTTMVEREKIPPWGVLGGEDGRPYRITLISKGKSIPVGGKETLNLLRDDLIVIETAGGGGYGTAHAEENVSSEERG